MGKPSNLLTQLLTETVIVYLANLVTTVSMEDGSMVEHPMIVDGILMDFDSDFILLDINGSVSVINIDSIAKIDLLDAASVAMGDVDRPDRGSMN